tara:strand:- start:1620 stop:2414 length:795 start_codon:yes stop_codon:yes gene_type:complete
MTLDTLEAITTPLRNKRTVWQTNEDGEFLRDEDSYRIAVLDDDGNEVKEFEYNRNSKKGSIWMIRIPDAVIKTVGIYETQTILEDEDYWDDPNVPEYYDKEVRIGTKLNREVGERPEIDLDDLHLVQTRHIDDYCRGDSLEAFYASHDEDYLRDQADKSASALAQATNQRKVSELSDDTWDLFVNTEGEKLFDPEKYRGESNRERYTKGEDHGGRYDYRPRISYGTLYAVNDLFRELKRSQEMANYWYEKYTEQCRVVEKMQGE